MIVDCLPEIDRAISSFAHAEIVSAHAEFVNKNLRMGGESFGIWLQRRLDGKQGWNKAELARRSGLSATSIGDWINGKKLPDPVSVKKLADALGADVLGAYRVLGWLDEPTADSPFQADLIAKIRKIDWSIEDGRHGGIEGALNNILDLDRRRIEEQAKREGT